MSNNKYAIIKLVTGEELFTQIEEFVEDKDKHLILMDPAIIREVPNRRGPFALFKIEPWLKLTNERMFCLDLKNVIYYARCKDEEKISTYRRYVKSLNKETSEQNPSKVGISSSLGFVCTVTQTRESLENLFKNS